MLLASAFALLCAGILGTVEAISWIGKPFAGFLVLENRVVASAGLSQWPATHGGDIYQYEIVAVDGRPADETESLRSYIAGLPVQTPVTYRMRKGDREIEREIKTRSFSSIDFSLLFGAYLLCGIGVGGVALSIRYLRGRDAVANGTFFPLLIVAMWALTAMDLYGPYRLFRLHALCEALLAAAMVHLALAFPSPTRWILERPRCILLPYALAAGLALANQIGLYSAPIYVATHLTAISAFGVGLIGLIGSQIARYLQSPSFENRQRIKIVALGTAAALGPQVVLALWSGFTGGKAPQNVMAFTGVLFPISVAYAVLRHNLLGVDELVRRSLNYAIFSVVVAVTYIGSMAAFDALLQGAELESSLTVGLFFGAFSALVLLPLREGLQRAVDRSFFRTAYDFNRIVETASQRLTSATDLRVISEELASSVGAALHPKWTSLYVRRGKRRHLEALEAAPIPDDALEHLLPRLETSVSPVEDELENLAVPFRIEGKLRAALLLGPRMSGRSYSGDDRRLLLTLANQGAVAIQNALALEELREINWELEIRVENRTRELHAALEELQSKNEQLTHLSATDALTGLRNRAFIDEALETEFNRARRANSGLALLMLDVDHFKYVNDRCGHQGGDQVLRQLAEIIARGLRATDIAGRFGGDEFVIILTHQDTASGAFTFAERLRGSVENAEFLDAEGRAHSVTLSIGVASLDPSHGRPCDLLAAADAALYRAKSSGRNRTEQAHPGCG